VPAGIEGVDGGAGGDGLAGADLAGDHPDRALVDEVGDAGDGFGMCVVAVEHLGGDVAAERGAGETVVGAETLDAHCCS
jgi:hypothetical protein